MNAGGVLVRLADVHQQGAACFGAAYEFLFNVRYQLARNHLQDQAPLTYLTAEPFAAHFGIGGFGSAQKMCEWLFSHYQIDARYSAVIKEVRADGVLLEGRTQVDESLLTGESAPVPKGLSSTVVAGSLNGDAGLWVRFSIDTEHYWLRTNPEPMSAKLTANWWWLLIALLVTILGSALIARLINQPLKQLSFAASRVRGGDFDASHLDEKVATSEIREVNIGFNRMAEQLAKIEQDRAVMLAGISHDLRTPLARLRLETEMSVADEEAREHMVADIAQLDAIIDKFLEYARPGLAALTAVSLAEVVEACAYPFRHADDIIVRTDVHPQLRVMADEVELARVLSNLLENARRYGKSPQTGVAVVEIAARQREDWVLIKVRDHGIGVSPEALDKLTKPFFRGDAARTAATGAGLGLAIVEKSLQRMGGTLELANAPDGGLVAHLRLKQAPSH